MFLFFKTRDISSKSMPLMHDRSKRLACETGAAEHRDTASNTIDSNRLRLQSQQTKDGSNLSGSYCWMCPCC